MNKHIKVINTVFLGLLLTAGSLAYAQNTTIPEPPQPSNEKVEKSDLRKDHKQMHHERKVLTAEEKAKREQMRGLHEQIRAARAAGDTAKAKELRAKMQTLKGSEDKGIRKERRKMAHTRQDINKDKKEMKDDAGAPAPVAAK